MDDGQLLNSNNIAFDINFYKKLRRNNIRT